ncbi:MAG TPA: glycosyltransferase family 4 protein [Candidatus Acidoferrales bacterium]|nr:glycosyltransferase family 4 protein [Candidatus Acidoferrales bacterium]
MTIPKFRLAVVSPFVDKRHGTERRVAEWLARLAETFEIHLYSQRVEDLDLSRIVWHRIPKFPAPHLFNYLWWFTANHIWRGWDRRFRGLHPDLVFSPGINCLDADVMSVHVVFAGYRRQNAASLRFRTQPLRNWPLILHRRLYYSLIALLERHLYRDPKKSLILISRRTGEALQIFYGRAEKLPVVYLGLDQEVFNPETRLRLRDEARRALHLSPGQFALLIIGNDWRNKGLLVILEVLNRLRELPLQLLVVGQDDPSPYSKLIEENGCKEHVLFLPPRKDVEFYYAAADAYVGPSLEDTFALPPAEAMACGVPIITSIKNGTSEIIDNGSDGLLISDPSDAKELAALVRKLYEDPFLRERIGAKASEKMKQFTWDRNGREMTQILLQVMEKKNSLAPRALRQEA